MNKGGFLGIIVVVAVLLIVGFFWFVGQVDFADDVKYVKVQTTCCPCEMGGEEKCVPESQETEYAARLENCSEDIVCVGSFNCMIESCERETGLRPEE